jgi:pheromone shutdown protein TraB
VGNSSGAGATAVDALDALRADPAAVASMISALDAASPALAAALLHERDEWLAWSAARSRAVCGARAVVCVLGAGHARGVAHHLLDHAHRPLFKELAGQGVSRREQRAAAVRRLGIDAVIGAGAWAAWEAVHSSGGLGGGGGL